MAANNERNLGLMMTAVGAAVIVLAVLLFGLTTSSGEIDWVSVVTAAAGAVMAGVGLYRVARPRGGGPSFRAH